MTVENLVFCAVCGQDEKAHSHFGYMYMCEVCYYGCFSGYSPLDRTIKKLIDVAYSVCYDIMDS
jgi:hypothetical protein